MKKAMFKILLAGVLLSFISGNALAACGSTVSTCSSISDTTGAGSGLTLKFSPNVQLGYNGSATSYAMATWNTAGSKGYGANSTFQGLYVTKADITSAPTVPGASAEFASGTWASLGQ